MNRLLSARATLERTETRKHQLGITITAFAAISVALFWSYNNRDPESPRSASASAAAERATEALQGTETLYQVSEIGE